MIFRKQAYMDKVLAEVIRDVQLAVRALEDLLPDVEVVVLTDPLSGLNLDKEFWIP